MDDTFDILAILLLICLLPLIVAAAVALAVIVGLLHTLAWVCAIVNGRAGCA